MSSQPVTLTLRYLRESARLTQSDLARIVEVNRVTVLRWEAGETVPDGWQIRRLAQALRVSEQVVVDALPAPIEPVA